jgi:hypothetical protein
MTPAEHWALSYGDSVGMVGDEVFPFPSEEAGRACWKKHRNVLMAEAPAGTAPDGLWRYEPESFVSLQAIRALRLDRESLSHGRNEFDFMASAARRNGRPEVAEEFQQRAERVRQVIAEMENAANVTTR